MSFRFTELHACACTGQTQTFQEKLEARRVDPKTGKHVFLDDVNDIDCVREVMTSDLEPWYQMWKTWAKDEMPNAS